MNFGTILSFSSRHEFFARSWIGQEYDIDVPALFANEDRIMSEVSFRRGGLKRRERRTNRLSLKRSDAWFSRLLTAG